jgi:hypothetical protein
MMVMPTTTLMTIDITGGADTFAKSIIIHIVM